MLRNNTYFLRKQVLKFLVAVVILNIPSSGHTQNMIREVRIEGNSRTKSAYLERFIKSQPETLVDTQRITDDLRKLRNLSSVMDAEASITHSDSGALLTYLISERYTLLPVGDFGITRDNFWIGGGLMESNLAGRGIYSYLYYQYNTKHTIHLIFRNPYIAGSSWGIELQLRNIPSVENYNEYSKIFNHYFDISFAGRYEFRFENEIAIGTSFRHQSADNTDLITSPEVSAVYVEKQAQVFFLRREIRKLDYRYFYVSGWKNLVYVACQIPYTSGINPVLTLHDEFKFFTRTGLKGNIALRSTVAISTEKEKAFYPFMADSYYSFRGIGYRAFRGNAMALLNVEYRFTLIENRIGGIQLVVFSDGGFLDQLSQISTHPIEFEPWQIYSGIGLRLIYKKAYNAIISIDYGCDVLRQEKAGLVVGWGQYF